MPKSQGGLHELMLRLAIAVCANVARLVDARELSNTLYIARTAYALLRQAATACRYTCAATLMPVLR
jgi:hypothetical protein